MCAIGLVEYSEANHLQEFYTTKKRLLSLLTVAIFVFIVIFGRIFYIQIIWGTQLQSLAYEQWTRDLSLEAMRGDIVDINGTVLVTSYTSYGVYVRPQSVSDSSEVASVLSHVLGLSYNDVYESATTTGISEVTIAKSVSQSTVDTLRSYDLDGVYFASESTRQYVYGDLLSQVLGYVSSDNVGQSGIEQYYNKYLSGTDGTVITEADLVGNELENTAMTYIAPIDGMTTILTIDYGVQTMVENVLDMAMQQFSPEGAMAIVMDASTGDIVAMSSKPSVDMNDLPRDDIEALMSYTKNIMLTDVYEPGSTFKILTVAANLQEYANGNSSAFSAEYVFTNNSGTRVVDGTTISCWCSTCSTQHVNQTLSDALTHSCNPIFTDVALSLGSQTMYDYLELFGYTTTTGIDYYGEQSSIIISQSSVTNGDLARIGFGQSIAVTPMQLCMATAAAINGGWLLEPNLVDSIVDSYTGITVYSNATTVVNRAIDQDVSEQVVDMLIGVVSANGGNNAYIDSYLIGGKTGTAQKFENGSIKDGAYLSSFIGFITAENTKYLVYVAVDEPQGQSYGSVVAAPYAKLIMQGLIDYYQIAPQV